MTKVKNKILLVDGMALLFRGYYATAYSGNFMRNSEGMPTNGVHQFLRYFLDGINTFNPTHVVCCWDMGSKTFRTELYDQYKANRGAPPEELIPQFDLVKEVVDIFNVPNIGLINYEADDIIGSLCNLYKDDHELIIQTGDFDMLQLVQNNVQVAIMKKGIGNYEVFDHKNFYEKRGLYPHQIVDFKGFTGDSADNYPGVKGIGEKTALKLLQTYGAIDTILDSMEELTKGIQSKLKENMEMFHLSRQLAEIKCDLSLSCILEDARVNFDIPFIDEQIKTLGIRFRPVAELIKA
ncbi:5'-3' exonuclease H3TH domain-containing protein [Pseudogracilibacillus sp. SE30717A]|uniref:5'-3' exonuclease n=1 Tax=Pseudogracilibacillus sp. SE30717A TaxID=3098293 RepID=UPI00300E4439